MEKNLYIDASHPNETRVVLKSNGHIEDYEYEGVKSTLIKNSKIDDAKIINVFLKYLVILVSFNSWIC